LTANDVVQNPSEQSEADVRFVIISLVLVTRQSWSPWTSVRA